MPGEPLTMDWGDFLGFLRSLDPGAPCGRARLPEDCPVARYARERWTGGNGHAYYYGHPWLVVYPPELRHRETYETRSRVVSVPGVCQVFMNRVDRAFSHGEDVPAGFALRLAETPAWRIAVT